MSVKKLLVLAAAGIASVGATAFAGGPDQMPAAPVFQPNIYVEGNVGYVQSNWSVFSGFNGLGSPFNEGTGSNFNGGFTFGFALGYNFIKHFSAELGWDWIPQANGSTTVDPSTNVVGLNVESWVIYLAGKLDIPVSDNFDLFGKLGVAYRSLTWGGDGATGLVNGTSTPNPTSDTGYWSPFFGAGGQYAFTDNFYGIVQWKHVMANVTNNNPSTAAPSANFYTAGIGYRFAI